MQSRLTIAPNEAVFTRTGKLVGRGRFFPPQLAALAEGKLFIIPPDAGLIRLVHEFPDQSPATRTELNTGGLAFSLLLGWRKYANDEYIAVKTVPSADWQQKPKLQPGFLVWLDAQTNPIFIVDNCGFILYANPEAVATHPTLAKSAKDVLFWSLLDELEALHLQEIWSQLQKEEGTAGFTRLFILRDEVGLVYGTVLSSPRPDEEAAELSLAGQRLALKHAGEGLLLLDKFGFILYASPNSAELMGLSDINLSGRRLISLVKDARQNMLLGRILGGDTIVIPLIVEIKHGEGKTLKVRLEAVELAPELKGRAALALRIKPAQELLRQQDREVRLSLLDELLGFYGGPLLASFSTLDETLLYISPNSMAWTGITPEQFQFNPRKFWALFPPALFTSASEPSTNSHTSVWHTILEKADGTVIPIKVQMATDVIRRRKDVFIQTLDSLTLGEEYAHILKALVDLNANPNLYDQLRMMLRNLLKSAGSERAIINIFDAITGNVISTVAEPESEVEYDGGSVPPDILPQAYETTLLAQRITQQSTEGVVVKRVVISNWSEECGELFLFLSADAGLDETDLTPWLNLLGLTIGLWRLQTAFAREDELNKILGYGLENIVVQAIQKLARDLLDLTFAGEDTVAKLNEITNRLELTLTSIRELQLFATIDRELPMSELLDLEQLLSQLGTEYIARLSQCGGILTIERGLPQIIAPREYMRLVFSRLIEYVLTNHRSQEPIRMNIDAHLLESATRIIFKITPSDLGADERHVLFNPYYGAWDLETKNIGLALVKKVIETIGGSITVLNDDSGSAVFSIFLPHRHR
jgi:PAS domain-containing protein